MTNHRLSVRCLRTFVVGLALALVGALPATIANAQDRLPSWNDGPSKTAIVGFVNAVTDQSGPDYVPPAERIATFDNDGTLWKEAPVYTQVVFAFDRVKAMASDHPEWKNNPALKAVLDGDLKALAALGMKGLMDVLMTTHAGMTTVEFKKIASDWIATAKDERFNKRYTELIYQPMLEVLAYLQANEFKTYIVSGGGVDFMRPWTDKVYNIPPEQVIGSSIVTKFEMRNGAPVLVREPKIFFVDDKDGKAIGIQRIIGRRPIASFGNADADIPMLKWALAGEGRQLGMLVHHTDAEREYAYDRKSVVGKLDKGIDGAATGGWMLIDMKKDWKVMFPVH